MSREPSVIEAFGKKVNAREGVSGYAHGNDHSLWTEFRENRCNGSFKRIYRTEHVCNEFLGFQKSLVLNPLTMYKDNVSQLHRIRGRDRQSYEPTATAPGSMPGS